MATLGSILDSQLSWKSGKFQLARWSHNKRLNPVWNSPNRHLSLEDLKNPKIFEKIFVFHLFLRYVLIHGCRLMDSLSKRDLCVLLTACICHDLDHPGFNNTYQINARTELAVRLVNNHKPVIDLIFVIFPFQSNKFSFEFSYFSINFVINKEQYPLLT